MSDTTYMVKNIPITDKVLKIADVMDKLENGKRLRIDKLYEYAPGINPVPIRYIYMDANRNIKAKLTDGAEVSYVLNLPEVNLVIGEYIQPVSVMLTFMKYNLDIKEIGTCGVAYDILDESIEPELDDPNISEYNTESIISHIIKTHPENLDCDILVTILNRESGNNTIVIPYTVRQSYYS